MKGVYKHKKSKNNGRFVKSYAKNKKNRQKRGRQDTLKRQMKKPMVAWYGKLFYGMGTLGYGLISQTMTSFIMFFGNAVMGVPGTLMGMAVSISVLWDAITDPIVGYFSDHTKSAIFGRRHGYILFGTFVMAILNILLWNVPDLAPFAKFIWFLVLLLALETANTLFYTPFSALAVELSGDYYERTIIQSISTVFFLIGLIVPTVLMAALQTPTEAYPDGVMNPESYGNMAYICSSLALVCGSVCFFGTYSHLPRLMAKAQMEVKPPKKPLRSMLKDFFDEIKDVNYRSVILGYASSLMAAAFLTSVGVHVFKFTFRLPTMKMYLLLGSLFVMTIFSQPFWLFVAKKLDKKRALLSGIGMTIVGVLMISFVLIIKSNLGENGLVTALFPGVLVTGFGTGAMYTMPTSMMGDAIAYEKAKNGIEKTATLSGFMTFGYKISQAGALLVIGVMLDIIGFNSNNPVQTPAVEIGLALILIFGVLISLTLGAIFYRGYRLKKGDIPNLEQLPVEILPEDSVKEKE